MIHGIAEIAACMVITKGVEFMDINMNGIYKIADHMTIKEACKKYRPSRIGMEFHCMNWVFTPREYKGQFYMVDTYWSSDSFTIEVDESNISDFKLVAIKDDIERVPSYEVQFYNRNDVIWLALDSSGSNVPHVVKGTKMSSDIGVKVLRSEIESLYFDIECKKDQISRILKGQDSRFDTFNIEDQK